METIFLDKIITRQNILDAMRDFDAQYSDSGSYDDWFNKATYKYAIRYIGRIYPPKHILSIAAGISTKEFSGGDQTNKVFCQLGFEVGDK